MKFSSLGSEPVGEEALSGDIPEADGLRVEAGPQASETTNAIPVTDEARIAEMAILVAKAAGVESVVVSSAMDLPDKAAVLVVLDDGAEWRIEPGPEGYVSVTSPNEVAKLIEQPAPAVQAAEESAASAASAEAPKEPSPLDSLLRLSAGHVAAEDVQVPATTGGKAASSFSSLPEVDPSIKSVEDLASLLASDEEIAAPSVNVAPEGGNRRGPGRASTGEAAPQGGGPVMQPGGMAVPGRHQTATTVGEVVGQAIGGAIVAPFVALSSAARHIRDNFPRPSSMVPPSRAEDLSAGKALPIANTLEKITEWKCERIEKAAAAVDAAAASLMETEGFAVWDDELQGRAKSLGISPGEALERMRSDPELAGVKEKMDALWTAHPDRVNAYREACDDFERNVRNVVAEFANSDDAVRDRVTSAMKKVEKKTENLPGFGENIGEYLRSLAERVRELAQMIADFMASLARKLGAHTRSNDVAPV